MGVCKRLKYFSCFSTLQIKMIDFRTYNQNPYDRYLLVILVIVFELAISVFVDLNARACVTLNFLRGYF